MGTVTSNKIIENLTTVTYGHSNLVAIKYPTNFPAPNDPFYLAATALPRDRMALPRAIRGRGAPHVVIR